MQQQHAEKIEVIDWGTLPFAPSASRQQRLVQERLAGQAPDRLILVEHPPVVAIGRRGASADLLISRALLWARGVEICQADRGGKTTYHGPGQLVAYPILELRQKDLHLYVSILLASVATLLREYGLEPEFRDGEPGIWVRGGKIASIGVAVKKWITSHGIALNVNNDLAPFGWIVACGKPEQKVTSMAAELGRHVDLSRVKERFAAIFRDSYRYAESGLGRHPSWLRLRAPKSTAIDWMESMLQGMQLSTVCQSAHCPNLGDCFSRGAATFMILGKECTRQCRFCAVGKGAPLAPDLREPERVARAAKKLGLKHVVVTSVTRDDLADGGAGQFAAVIACLRKELPSASVEVLVPDFQGNYQALEAVFKARPEVFAHNMETVSQLYPAVRPQADYLRSLGLLGAAAEVGLPVKSGLMLGLGERPEQVLSTLGDMRKAGCDYLTLGQYLAPSADHAPVVRYLSPGEFDQWAEKARAMGFSKVAAGPLVRSSYRADEMHKENNGE